MYCEQLLIQYSCQVFISGPYQAHAGHLSKMIIHVTVGALRDRSAACLEAFGKMSGVDCSRFLRSPHTLFLLFIFTLARSILPFVSLCGDTSYTG